MSSCFKRKFPKVTEITKSKLKNLEIYFYPTFSTKKQIHQLFQARLVGKQTIKA